MGPLCKGTVKNSAKLKQYSCYISGRNMVCTCMNKWECFKNITCNIDTAVKLMLNSEEYKDQKLMSSTWGNYLSFIIMPTCTTPICSRIIFSHSCILM